MNAILAIFFAQSLYTVADIWQKVVLGGHGFSFKTLSSLRFLLSFLISGTAFTLQMYALSKLELSWTIILLSSFGVVLAAVGGVLYFKDQLSLKNYVGIAFAIAAIWLVHSK